MTIPISLRPVTPEDEALLRMLYASTREEELAPLGWPAAQVEAFLDMQFQAREAHYHEHYPAADDCIVLVDGEPAGRLDLSREDSIIRIIDIVVAPSFRGRGVGTQLLEAVIQEATKAALPVELHVEVNNPAQQLYRRLGFVQVAERFPYLRMEWRPENQPAQPKATS